MADRGKCVTLIELVKAPVRKGEGAASAPASHHTDTRLGMAHHRGLMADRGLAGSAGEKKTLTFKSDFDLSNQQGEL